MTWNGRYRTQCASSICTPRARLIHNIWIGWLAVRQTEPLTVIAVKIIDCWQGRTSELQYFYCSVCRGSSKLGDQKYLYKMARLCMSTDYKSKASIPSTWWLWSSRFSLIYPSRSNPVTLYIRVIAALFNSTSQPNSECGQSHRLDELCDTRY